MNSSTKSDNDDDADDSSNVISPRTLTDLLVFLSPNDNTYDNVSESNSVSIVLHPFSDENPKSSKNTTKQSFFSNVHEEIMKEISAEQEKTESLCSTCYSCSSCSTDTWEALGIDINKVNSIKPQPFPEELKKELQDKINAYSIKTKKYQEKTDGENKTIKLRKKDKKYRKKPDPMSGLWNMLSTYNEFVVTQPGYNAYQQEKPHWLDQEGIRWSEKEKARRKCVKWLEKYHK